jgi:hypothetical protein
LTEIIYWFHVTISTSVTNFEKSWLEAWSKTHRFCVWIFSFTSKSSPELFGLFVFLEDSESSFRLKFWT